MKRKKQLYRPIYDAFFYRKFTNELLYLATTILLLTFLSSQAISADTEILQQLPLKERLNIYNEDYFIPTARGYTNFSKSPKENLIAIGTNRGIQLQKLNNIKEIKTIPGSQDFISSIAFNFNGDYIASSSGCSYCSVADYDVKIWNTNDLKILYSLKGHLDGVSNIIFSPKENILASSTLNSELIIWDLRQKEPKKTKFSNLGNVDAIAFSDDGIELIISNTSGELYSINPEKAKITSKNKLNNSEFSTKDIKYTRDQKKIAIARLNIFTFQSIIEIRDRITKKIIHKIEKLPININNIDFSSRLMLASFGDFPYEDSGSIELWDTNEKRLLHSFTDNRAISKAKFISNGNQIIFSSQKGGLSTIDLKSRKKIENQLINGKITSSNMVDFDPFRQENLAIAHKDGSIVIWDTGKKSQSKT